MKKTFKILVIVFLLFTGLKVGLTNRVESILTPAQEFEQLQSFLNYVNTDEKTNADVIGLKSGVTVAVNLADYNGITIDKNGNVISIIWDDFDAKGDLNLSNFNKLEELILYRNELTSLDLNNLKSLKYLNCVKSYSLTNLDVGSLTNLTSFNFSNNQGLKIKNLDSLKNLKLLYCDYSAVTNLNLSSFRNLEYLSCSRNKLITLDLIGLKNLKELDCSHNDFTSLDFNGLTNLEILDCSYNNLISLDISNVINLRYLDCSVNELTTLDVSNLIKLEDLDYSHNQLTNVDISNLPSTIHLYDGGYIIK